MRAAARGASRGGRLAREQRAQRARGRCRASPAASTCTSGAISLALNEVVSPEITHVTLGAAARVGERVLVGGLEAGSLEAQHRAARGLELRDVQLEAQLVAADRQLLADPRADPQRAGLERLVRPPARSSSAAPCRRPAARGTPPPGAWRRSPCSRSASLSRRPGSGRAGCAAGRPRPGAGEPSDSATRRSSSATRAESILTASATGSGRCAQSASGPSGRAPSTRTGWPGTPTTVEFGGTSWITTEFAPIFEPWPIVIGPEQLRARTRSSRCPRPSDGACRWRSRCRRASRPGTS